MPVVAQVVEGVCLVKLEGKMFLRTVINAYNFESGSKVSRRSTTS
jgi:hypothetical protein